MVELPLELIHNIVARVIPPFDSKPRSRQKLLTQLCHLPPLQRFAQRLLFQHISLLTKKSVLAFQHAIESQTETFDFGSCVQSLRMGTSNTIERTGPLVSRVVDRCGAINKAEFYYVGGINFADLAKLSSTFEQWAA